MEAGNGTAISSSSRDIAGRKEGPSQVHNQPAPLGGPPRKKHSFSALKNRMRSWWSHRSQPVDPPIMPQELSPEHRAQYETLLQPTAQPMIPQELSPEERAQYETLLRVVKARSDRGSEPPRVVVITDLAKDYDDLAAMVVLKELHRLGVIKLLGFIANLEPAKERTRFGRGALDSLGLKTIPIARGTSGFPNSSEPRHRRLDYEFKCDFMANEDEPRLVEFIEEGSGEQLLRRLCLDAVNTGQKLTLMLISSLEDIYTFSQHEQELLEGAVSNIVLQGGYTISAEGKLVPDPAANNNRYDISAATEFHSFIQDHKIPSMVYTKVAAFATPLTSAFFAELANTNHPIGKHLREVQVWQDLSFYKTASKKDEKERFAPFMDQEWFLENKTSWFDSPHPPNNPLPEGEEVIPYLTKVVVYDALAALGTSGDDAIDALKVLTSSSVQPSEIHKIVGLAGPPSDPGVDPERMATVLSALLKGSLVSCSLEAKR